MNKKVNHSTAQSSKEGKSNSSYTTKEFISRLAQTGLRTATLPLNTIRVRCSDNKTAIKEVGNNKPDISVCQCTGFLLLLTYEQEESRK